MKDSNPFTTLFKELKPTLLWDMMIGLPGKVISYDPDLQRAVVECGIQRHEGKGEFKSLPHIEHVPVQFAGTAQWPVFHELPEGTEGFIHFSHRSVDYWLEQGGPVRPLDARMFDASDAFFAPGYRSRATCINHYVAGNDYVSGILIGTSADDITKGVIAAAFNQLGVFSTENIQVNYV